MEEDRAAEDRIKQSTHKSVKRPLSASDARIISEPLGGVSQDHRRSAAMLGSGTAGTASNWCTRRSCAQHVSGCYHGCVRVLSYGPSKNECRLASKTVTSDKSNKCATDGHQKSEHCASGTVRAKMHRARFMYRSGPANRSKVPTRSKRTAAHRAQNRAEQMPKMK